MYIKQNIQARLNTTEEVSISQTKWEGDPALRFYDKLSWTAGANLTVRIGAETGFYRLGIYLPGELAEAAVKIHNHFNLDDKYEEFWKGKDKDKPRWRTIWGKKEDDLQDLNSMFEEASGMIKFMNDYYKGK